MRRSRVAVEQLVEGVGSGPDVGDDSQLVDAVGIKPAAGRVVQDGGRLGRVEVFAPGVEHLLNHGVDIRVKEGSEATGGAHGPVEDGTDGDADEAEAVGAVIPRGSAGEDTVEDLEEVLVVADLGVAGGRVAVGFLFRDLLEHGLEEHVDAGVFLDQVLELLQHGVQGLVGGAVHLRDEAF